MIHVCNKRFLKIIIDSFKAQVCTVANLYIYSFWNSWCMYYQPCNTLTKQHLLADSNVLAACHVHVLSCIEADHTVANMNKLANIHQQPMDELSAPR